MKGQSDIVSLVLIVVISIGLLGAAYTWSLPLIQKRQDTTKFERIYSFFDPANPNSLERKIIYTARTGSDSIFSSDFEGIWIIDKEENSITFTFFSKVTGFKPTNEWISLIPKSSCPSTTGYLGSDEPFSVCGKAKPAHDGFEVTFKVWFINLTDIDTGENYLIKLNVGGLESATGKSLKIEYDSVEKTQKMVKTNVDVILL